MSFIDDFKAVQDKEKKDITQSGLIVKEALMRSGFDSATAAEQYSHIYEILDARNSVHEDIVAAGLKEDVSVVGKVTEYICEIGLRSAAETRYSRLPKTWDWVGDFAVIGIPFNLFISVKSYTAKERLIVSGTGQNAAPVVGYGLFKEMKEWTPDRVKQYKQRGFVAIYMPKDLYDELSAQDSQKGDGYPATGILNIYDRPLLRKLEDFADDISKVCILGDYTLDLSRF